MLKLQNSFRSKPIEKCYHHVTSQQRRYIGWFARIPTAEPDAIFGLVEQYQKDTHKPKINLSIGVFRTDEDKPYILKCVRKAEEKIFKKKMDKEYSPVVGYEIFKKLSMDFTFGKKSEFNKPGRHVTFQGLSGCGGLSIAAQFLKMFYPGCKTVYMSDPTWPNHGNLFNKLGLETDTYRYYNAENISLDFDGMMEDIHKMPYRSMILFHASAHNPTGFDPTEEQWKEITEEVKRRKLYVIMDNAYQGFASGDLDKDARGFRIMAERHVNMVLVTSYAKNFGLYGERVGATSFLVDSKNEADKILSQLILLIRANHSNPPLHGARIVEEVFTDPCLTKLWIKELKIMANRLKSARETLVKKLKETGSSRNWDFIAKQIGMFSYTGLTKEQVTRLRKEFHIYMLTSGRLAIPGVTSKNVEYLAKCIHKVTS